MEGVASSLIRLGHLFSTSGFRGKFTTALRFVVRGSFVYKLCMGTALPPSSVDNRRHLAALLRGTSCLGLPTALEAEVIDFFHSNPNEETIYHYCTGAGCCADARASATRAERLVLQLLCHTLPPVPLLYRWKNFDTALAWSIRATGFHRLLGRTLLQVMKGINDTDMDALELDDVNLNFGAMQGVRCRKAAAFFTSHATLRRLSTTSLVAAPFEYLGNALFGLFGKNRTSTDRGFRDMATGTMGGRA
jgi:hypothetical protein